VTRPGRGRRAGARNFTRSVVARKPRTGSQASPLSSRYGPWPRAGARRDGPAQTERPHPPRAGGQDAQIKSVHVHPGRQQAARGPRKAWLPPRRSPSPDKIKGHPVLQRKGNDSSKKPPTPGSLPLPPPAIDPAPGRNASKGGAADRCPLRGRLRRPLTRRPLGRKTGRRLRAREAQRSTPPKTVHDGHRGTTSVTGPMQVRRTAGPSQSTPFGWDITCSRGIKPSEIG